VTPDLLLDEARRTRALLRTIDDELRARPKRRVTRDTWAAMITQAVMLDAAIATTEALLEALDG
jgi:hypothetical protein